jgi:hypothetical protein
MPGTKGHSGGARAGAGAPPEETKKTFDLVADKICEYIEKCADSLNTEYVKRASTEKVLMYLMDRILPLDKSAPQQAPIQISFQRFDGQVVEAQVLSSTEERPAPAILSVI